MTDDIQPIDTLLQDAVQVVEERQTEPRPSYVYGGRTFIYFKSAGWRLQMYTPHGIQYVNIGSHDLADVKLALKQPEIVKLLGEVMADEINADGLRKMINRTIIFEDAVEEWRNHIDRHEGLSKVSVKVYYYTVRTFLRRCKLMKKPVNSIDTDHLIDQCNNVAHNLRAITRAYRLLVMRRFLDWCAVKGYSLGNVARLLKRVNVRDLPIEQKVPRYKKPFTDEQIQKIFAHFDKRMAEVEKKIADVRIMLEKNRNRPYWDPGAEAFYNEKCRKIRETWWLNFNWKACTILALEVGLRLYDCVHLEWDSILPNEHNQNGKYILIYTHKRDRRLMIPMPQAVRELIPYLLDNKQDDRYVFPHLVRRYEKKSLGFGSEYCVFLKAAGIPKGMSFHCLRVTYAYRCRDKGLSMEHIRQLLTHLDAETTERYLGGPDGQVFPLEAQLKIYRELNETNEEQAG